MVAAATDPPEIEIPIEPEVVEPPNGETPPEPKPFNKTQKDFDALNAVLAKERASHKEDHDARVTLEQAGASESERAWQAKVDAATNASDNRLKAVAARAALTTAGLQGSPTKLVALLDLTAVVVDDDGEVIGLEDQVKALATEYPALFAAPTAPKPGQINVGTRKPPVSPTKNWGQQIAEQFATGRK